MPKQPFARQFQSSLADGYFMLTREVLSELEIMATSLLFYDVHHLEWLHICPGHSWKLLSFPTRMSTPFILLHNPMLSNDPEGLDNILDSMDRMYCT
jgi:hypothetical protein